MIDMGLVPPEGTAEEEGQAKEDSPALDDEGVEEDGGGDGADELAEAIGLIGHFEAAHLVTRKGIEGSFVGSLDMSMTERDLVSTEDGVGKRPSWIKPNCRLVRLWLLTTASVRLVALLSVVAQERAVVRQKTVVCRPKRHRLSPVALFRVSPFPHQKCRLPQLPSRFVASSHNTFHVPIRTKGMVGQKNRVGGCLSLGVS